MLFYFPWRNQNNRVYNCKIILHNDIDKIRKWVISQEPDKNNSTHWWYSKLPSDISYYYYKIATDKNIINMFKNNFGSNYNIDIINDMNELYVTTPVINNAINNNSSDNIFYIRHIDGPYYLFPFASCYRVIIGLDNNSKIVTRFNMIPKDTIVTKGDVIAFDFHRESHYIYNQNTSNIIKYNHELNDNFRVILKIHYCIYPWWAYYFGKMLSKLSINYNKNFRNLFLFTLKTNKFYKRIITYFMILSTKIFHDLEYYIGINNLSFTFILFYISYLTHSKIFLFGCMLIYYIRKIKKIEDNSNLIILKRDLRFYYSLYCLQIYYIYYNNLLYTSLYFSYLTNSIFCIFLYTDLNYLYTLSYYN